MPLWTRTVNIKPILLDSSLTFTERGYRVADLLETDPDLEVLADPMREAAATGDPEEIDSVLEAVYDVGDDLRIWLGP